ncbi:MAG: repeat protein, partial [Verrucomicrobiales bacterium]|nr:repeat protein [Verrucomicrobiales bacterium]
MKMSRSHNAGYQGRLFPSLAAILALLLSLPFLAHADVSGTPISLRAAGTNSEGLQTFSLGWAAISNTPYQVQQRDSLDPGSPWRAIDLALPTNTLGAYRISVAGPASDSPGAQQRFFQILSPQPRIIRIEPAVGSTTGGTVYLVGQCLGTNGQVRIGGALITPQIVETGTLYRCVVPALPEGTYDVTWLQDGQVVAQAYKLFSITAEVQPAGFVQRLMEVPVEPPASPSSARGKKLYVGNLPFVEGGDGSTSQWPLRKGSKMTHSLQSRQDMLGGARRVSGEDCDDSDPAVMPFSGEVRVQTVDMVIPGRGLDFVWARTYRSRTGRPTPMGNRWDHSYNIYCEQIGNAIAVYDGTGRRDLYFPGTNGVYAC